MKIFYRGIGKARKPPPTPCLATLIRLCSGVVRARNKASILTRKEVGKVTFAKVKQPSQVTPDIPGTYPHKPLISRSPYKDYGLALARVEDGKVAGIFCEPSHGRSPPSPLGELFGKAMRTSLPLTSKWRPLHTSGGLARLQAPHLQRQRARRHGCHTNTWSQTRL